MTDIKNTDNTMGERLRQLREAFSYSQRELADRAGVSPGVVVKLEHDARQPRPSTVRKLADALGVSPTYLTGQEISAAAAASVKPTTIGSPPPKTAEPVLGFVHAPGMATEASPERSKVEVSITGVPDEAVARRLEKMFERWMEEDEESGEPDRWPEIARSLDEDRTSYRKFFK